MKYLKLLLLFSLVINVSFVKSQDVVKSMKLYVIPLYFKFRVSVKSNEVKKLSTLKIKAKEGCTKYELDEIFDKLVSNNDTVSKVRDFRVLLVLKRKFFGQIKIYFNQFGDYYYKGKYYKNNGLFEMILPNLPDCSK